MDIIELIEELKELKFEIKVIKDILSEIDKENIDETIKIGSRVLIKWDGGDIGYGRVEGIRASDGALYVHRDGYKSVIGLGIDKPGLAKHTLENLSIGIYGKLDRRLWSTENQISEINESLKKLINIDNAQFDRLIKSI